MHKIDKCHLAQTFWVGENKALCSAPPKAKPGTSFLPPFHPVSTCLPHAAIPPWIHMPPPCLRYASLLPPFCLRYASHRTPCNMLYLTTISISRTEAERRKRVIRDNIAAKMIKNRAKNGRRRLHTAYSEEKRATGRMQTECIAKDDKFTSRRIIFR